MQRLPFLTQISAYDLDITVVGQLPATNLPLSDQFEPGPMKMIGFKAPFGCGCLVEQGLEHPPADTHDAFILADPDAELDDGPFGVPVRIRGKTEEHCDLLGRRVSCSGIVLKVPESARTSMAAVQGERIPGGNATIGDAGRRSGGFILITGIDRVRYAVTHHAVAVIHDADESHDEAIV
jgi:hypothetical protein